MENVSLIILSAFATIGILLISRMIYLALFSRELKRAAIVIPFYNNKEPIAETLRALERSGMRVIAVDMCGEIEREQYCELGLCSSFLTKNEVNEALFSDNRGGK